MNAKEALKEAMAQKGATYGSLGSNMGKSTQDCWNLINGKNNNLKVNTLVTMLNALGYDLVIVDKATSFKKGIKIDEVTK